MKGVDKVSYLALYRQWRPQLLGEIVGQRHVTETLRNALVSGKVSHAYLFCGPRGTGKTSTAKVLARAVNCLEQQRGEPCNQCRNCKEIQSGATMDVIEIDAASNRGIDEVRELKENIKFFPSRGGKRIYIIDEVHMLTNEAFNALLKTLEEPPGHVVFVLATTEPHKVPLTILSRCQRFDFRPIPDELIAERLEEVAIKSDFNVDGAAVRAITRAAGGSLRDALSVLDQALLMSGTANVIAETVHNILGTVREDILGNLAAGLAERKIADVLKQVADITAQGKDLGLLAGELAEYLRQLLVIKIMPENHQEIIFNAVEAENLLEVFSQNSLLKTIDLLLEAEQIMRRSTHSRVVLELALIRAMDDNVEPNDAGKLLERIEQLERAMLSSGQANKRNLSGSEESEYKDQIVEKFPQTGNTKINAAIPPVLKSKVENLEDHHKVNNEVLNQPNAEPETKPEGAIQDLDDLLSSGSIKDSSDQHEKVVNATCRYGIDQIKKWWPEILELLKKKNLAAYTYLSQVWPAEVNEQCLILGVQNGDIFSKQMAEDAANRELLAEVLQSLTRLKWQIRCDFYDAPPSDWGEDKTQLDSEEAISLFQGTELPVKGDMDKN